MFPISQLWIVWVHFFSNITFVRWCTSMPHCSICLNIEHYCNISTCTQFCLNFYMCVKTLNRKDKRLTQTNMWIFFNWIWFISFKKHRLWNLGTSVYSRCWSWACKSPAWFHCSSYSRASFASFWGLIFQNESND